MLNNNVLKRNFYFSANQQNTAVSVVRVGAPSQGDDSSQDSNGTCDSQNDGNPHVNLTVEGFYPPPATAAAAAAPTPQTSTSEGKKNARSHSHDKKCVCLRPHGRSVNFYGNCNRFEV